MELDKTRPDLPAWRCLWETPRQPDGATVKSLGSSSDGRRVLATTDSGDVLHVWDARTGELLGLGPTAERWAANGSVRWDLTFAAPAGAAALPEDAHGDGPLAYGADASGRVLTAFASRNTDTVRIWDAASATQIGPELKGGWWRVRDVKFGTDADGRTLLVFGGWDRSVWLWDVATGEQVWPELKGHASWVEELAFGTDADGRTFVASGGSDGVTLLWDVARGERVGPELVGSGDWVNKVALGLDASGRLLLAVTYLNDTVRVWDVGTGDPVAGWAIPNGGWSIAFDGSLLAIGSMYAIAMFEASA